MENKNNKKSEVEYVKKLDLTEEEIEGYSSCSSRTQLCLTDCPWPFSAAYISSSD